ncbi:serine/threonine-protein kinase HipA [Arthrobacter subterraneus]|uniref:Serine/threonine-protein kinase HipA n=1 Tax=Arthrobacter subterraneus TaxID=335973 RepID=A0A1G8GZK3_9MICC|nr:HipA domain-containing protein [Arthrobacter subterraneus]SDH99838.1 serine/threonine-protein kinase HipA [Arthrobacter subterraneus]
MRGSDLQDLRFIRKSDVYQNGVLAGHLERTSSAGTRFSYTTDFLGSGSRPIATTLPLTESAVETPAGSLPAFFAGLLPEGYRLSLLRRAVKTSLDDELTLLLAVGADVPGDVQVVPHGEAPAEPKAAANATSPEETDFASLFDAVDLHALPGVQAKASASMLTVPLAIQRRRYILKLNPPEYPHLIHNEAMHLAGAKALKIPVTRSSLVADRNMLPGLLVERFDRRWEAGALQRLPQEDATQVLNLPPGAKYGVDAEEVVLALAGVCKAGAIARRNLYLQFLFAWLTGNGDLHAKNVSVLGSTRGDFVVAPVYDIPCTLLYGDNTMALPIAGRIRNLKAKHWAEFADTLGLPERAVKTAIGLALTAAKSIDLDQLPFSGSPLNGAKRELRFRRRELAD